MTYASSDRVLPNGWACRAPLLYDHDTGGLGVARQLENNVHTHVRLDVYVSVKVHPVKPKPAPAEPPPSLVWVTPSIRTR